ncbi:MAG: hypothetical protein Q8P67_15605 [archaeon]|nr:hypothetical protein [archaeon]
MRMLWNKANPIVKYIWQSEGLKKKEKGERGGDLGQIKQSIQEKKNLTENQFARKKFARGWYQNQRWLVLGHDIKPAVGCIEGEVRKYRRSDQKKEEEEEEELERKATTTVCKHSSWKNKEQDDGVNNTDDGNDDGSVGEPRRRTKWMVFALAALSTCDCSCICFPEHCVK